MYNVTCTLCTFPQGYPELNFVYLERHFLLLDLKKYKKGYQVRRFNIWSTINEHKD